VQLRPYQTEAKASIYQAWQDGHKNVLYVLPTGGGKTVTMADVVREHRGASCLIAHRQELVTQISVALARAGVKHRLIAPNNVVKLAISLHIQEVGASYYAPQSLCAVAGVDTLLRRGDTLQNWANSVTLWLMDEAHHVLRENKWGGAVALFPNAKGLGVTATPTRADGKGLGSTSGGVFSKMIVGTYMRDLINQGFLTEYRIFAPPSDLDLQEVKVSQTTGDYSPVGLSVAVRKSHLIGDVVQHYLRFARGKLGVTFAIDVATATEIARQFNEAGVVAEVVSAKTPDRERVAVLRKFKRRGVLQLVNVDLFGEGFDLPAIEVVSMARPTQSFALYAQQFGRALRILEGKTHALIIDHVGNVMRHGLPDATREWSLDPREKRSTRVREVTTVKTCPTCLAVYGRVNLQCPYCGNKPEPVRRSSIEQVEGDLIELDPAVLAQMRHALQQVDKAPEELRMELQRKGVPLAGVMANVKRQRERQATQKQLRDMIALWGGYRTAEGKSISEAQRYFYIKFGVDVLTAQTLGAVEAQELLEKVKNDTI